MKPINDNEIRIIVAGTASIGKSTIVQMIAKVLDKNNISVDLIVDNYDQILVEEDYQKQRVEVVKNRKKTKVVIEERRVYKLIDKKGYNISGVRD